MMRIGPAVLENIVPGNLVEVSYNGMDFGTPFLVLRVELENTSWIRVTGLYQNGEIRAYSYTISGIQTFDKECKVLYGTTI